MALEHSTNGLRAAAAAGMALVAVPMAAFPPAPEAVALAELTVDGVAAVPRQVVQRAFATIR